MRLSLQNLDSPLRLDANGVVRVGDTRVTLETVIRRFLSGDTPEEISEAYLLTLSHSYSTISYFLQHRTEVYEYLREVENHENEAFQMIERNSNTTALREKLMARMAAKNRAE